MDQDMPAIPATQVQRGYIIPIGGAEGKGRKPVILKRFVELCGGEDARIASHGHSSRTMKLWPEV